MFQTYSTVVFNTIVITGGTVLLVLIFILLGEDGLLVVQQKFNENSFIYLYLIKMNSNLTHLSHPPNKKFEKPISLLLTKIKNKEKEM